MNVQTKLKNIRISKEINQKEVALDLGCKQQMISKIECRSSISTNTLKKYANYFNQELSLEPKVSKEFETSFLYTNYTSLCLKDDIILSHVAALEALGLFSGYSKKYVIEYYSEKDNNIPGTICHTVLSLQEVGMTFSKGTHCTDVNRTFNDVLMDCDRIDDTPILESLNMYYYEHGKSFDSLILSEQAREKLNLYYDDAINY